MLFQRVRAAGNRAENKPSNGPLRARGKASVEYSATWRHMLVAGDMQVSCGACGFYRETRWHHG
ncbi:hypothetical protein D1641_05265 [Colidextribacter sp. OB.20]|nr:hypothetical protein [Colidextribacter sp. OB.20]